MWVYTTQNPLGRPEAVRGDVENLGTRYSCNRASPGKHTVDSSTISRLKRNRFLQLGGGAVVAGLCAYSPANAATLRSVTRNRLSQVPAKATLTIDRSRAVGAVVPKLAGLAYEKSVISTPCLTTASEALAECFRLLGPSILRLGGNSTDFTNWVPNGNGGTAGQVASLDIDRLAAFLREAGWQIIYGINLARNTPASASAEAAYAASALGESLYAFEIGNEPDGYVQKGLRPSTYTFSEFVAEWSGFASAIRQKVPNAPLSGPAVSYEVATWTVPFAALKARDIKLLTQHYYMAAGYSPTPTITEMLSGTPTLSRTLTALRSAVSAHPSSGGFRLAEANSFYDGGASGVSNSFASALWTIDFLLTCATFGAAGANLQGGGYGSNEPYYTPIADVRGAVTEIRPVYYGMLFVSRLPPGPMYPVAVNSDLEISAYSVASSDGATYLVIINKDPLRTIEATVLLDAYASSAAEVALHGPNLGALTGTTLGAAPVSLNGTWSPKVEPIIHIAGRQLTVQTGAASAKLLRIT
jgi:hypothetical protein